MSIRRILPVLFELADRLNGSARPTYEMPTKSGLSRGDYRMVQNATRQ